MGLQSPSRLENPMDRGAWRATVRGVIKSRTRLSRCSHIYNYIYLHAIIYWLSLEQHGFEWRGSTYIRILLLFF